MFDSLDKRLWTKPELTNIGSTGYLLVTNRAVGEIAAQGVCYPYTRPGKLEQDGFKALGPAGKRMMSPAGYSIDEVWNLAALARALSALQLGNVVYGRAKPTINGAPSDWPKEKMNRARTYMESGITRQALDVSLARWKGNNIQRVAHYVDPGVGAYTPRWVYPTLPKGEEDTAKIHAFTVSPRFLDFAHECAFRRAFRKRMAANITSTAAGYVIYNRDEDTIRFMPDRELYALAGEGGWVLKKTGYIGLIQRLPVGENLLCLESDDVIDRMVRKYMEMLA